MEKRFKSVLDNLSADTTRTNTILAVSGGIDSVVMAYLCWNSGIPFSIAHCNFQLRDKESLSDEEFVMALGEKLGVKVLVKRFETEKYVADNGVSVQMAARELRHSWFNELADEFNANIATAHHANDVAETMLFNFTKGTSLAGLHGIIDSDGIIIRPLLWAKKYEIVEYAQKGSIEWREDRSNESEKYMRNIIRRKVIPELERINPGLITTSLRNAAKFKDAEDFIQYNIEQLGILEEKDGHTYIDKRVLQKLPGNATVLYQLINPYGFSYEQGVSIIESSEQAGGIFRANNWVLNVDRDYLIISKNDQHPIARFTELEDKYVEFESFSLNFELLKAEEYKIINDNQLAAFDFEKLTFPLLIRNWREGDYFNPLGMRGKKKVSDFMIDEKIPVNLKRDILVMLSGDDIVWVLGWRINEYYKITENTNQIYEVKMVYSK